MGDFLIENGILKKYSGSGGEVIIPDGVTRIGAYAFSGCKSLTGVTLPDITAIGDHAFSGCENLKGITIPDSVVRIGELAFFGCSGLTDITLPAGVTGIAQFSFGRCFGLKSVTLPDSIVSIGDGAFWMCTSLAGITLPDIDCIRGHVFQGCESLKNVIIPDSVTVIGEEAFSVCGSLESVVIPDSVTAIGEEAFSECGSLKSVVIPDSVTAIGEKAFSGCGSLKSVVIPDSVTRIGDSAFYGCRDLKDITIPSAAEYGKQVFSGCSALKDKNGSVVINGTLYAVDDTEKNLTIPDGVTRIVSRAFSGRRVIETVFAPKLRLGVLKACGSEIPAVRAFIQRYREYSDPAVIADYVEYISDQREMLLPEILEADAVDVLRMLAEAKKITITNLERDYLMPAVRCGAGECAAYLDTLPGFRTVPHIIRLHGLCDGVHFTLDGEEMLRYEEVPGRTEYAVPEGTRIIGEKAFYRTGLREIRLPASVTVVREGAFWAGSGSELWVWFPKHRISIPAKAFRRDPGGKDADICAVTADKDNAGTLCEDCRVRCVYTGGPLDDLSSKAKRLAVSGFMAALERHPELVDPWRESYLRYIRQNGKTYMKLAADDPLLLGLMLEEMLLNRQGIGYLLQRAAEKKDGQMTAALEKYRDIMTGDRDMDTIDLIRACYLEHHREKTLRHAEEVASTAAGLAGIHGLDRWKARLAALLHDISAVMTPQEMYSAAVSRGMELDPAEEKYHFLLHQRMSRIMAEEMFSVTDPDILSAVECHTTLKEGAGAYDELIFISDKISWDQEGKPPYHNTLLALAESSLDEACFFYIGYQFDHGLVLMPHSWMTGAYEELKKRVLGKQDH